MRAKDGLGSALLVQNGHDLDALPHHCGTHAVYYLDLQVVSLAAAAERIPQLFAHFLVLYFVHYFQFL